MTTTAKKVHKKTKSTLDETTFTDVFSDNTKRRYKVVQSFKGQINNDKFSGKEGDIIEMEPWQAKLLRTYIKDIL